MMGMVDDIIGVSEEGTKAAEKGLQFGVSKCKKNLSGKDIEYIEKCNRSVDK